MVYELKIASDGGTSNGGIWITYREPETSRFGSPQRLDGFDAVTDPNSAAVLRHPDGQVEVFVSVRQQQSMTEIFGMLCSESSP